jgi:hypothetical protein
MDRLSGGIDALYRTECRGWIEQPWALRNSYINVMLGKMDVIDLLQRFSSKTIPTPAATRLSHLLEAQQHCQAMANSCGWFFEDLNRIETRHVLGQASLAVEQAKLATNIDLAPDLRGDLAAAKSWITDETGRDIYDRVVAQRSI